MIVGLKTNSDALCACQHRLLYHIIALHADLSIVVDQHLQQHSKDEKTQQQLQCFPLSDTAEEHFRGKES